MTLMLILKYSIVQIGLLKDNIDNFTIIAIIYYVFIFNITNSIEKYYKFGLVY